MSWAVDFNFIAFIYKFSNLSLLSTFKTYLFYFSPKWFGILYSWADSKKKSSLMLSLFEPGTHIMFLLFECYRLSSK